MDSVVLYSRWKITSYLYNNFSSASGGYFSLPQLRAPVISLSARPVAWANIFRMCPGGAHKSIVTSVHYRHTFRLTDIWSTGL